MTAFTGCCILVVGDIMLDEYVETVVNRISPEAPVPVARIVKQWCVPGGAANVARNLVRLGCRVVLAGLRGHDAAGDRLQTLLEEQGVRLCLECTATGATIRKQRIVAQGQQLIRLDSENRGNVPQHHLETLWRHTAQALPEVSAVVLSDYGKGVFQDSEHGSLAARCIALCRSRNIPVLVDPKGPDWKAYAGADCVTPNTRELTEAAGSDDSFAALQEGARRLMRQHGLPRILLTRSEKGMALLEPEREAVKIPAVVRETADVSGAGDTVIAVLAACIAAGMDWVSAAQTANLAAGVVVGKRGTSPVEPEELRAALQTAAHTTVLKKAVNALFA